MAQVPDSGLTDSLNPVIFDDDGEIIKDLFGSANRFVVLGFAGPDGFINSFETIVDGQAFFNCFCLSGNTFGATLCADAGVTFSEADLDFTMMHEFGHFLGFDHTQVNQATAESSCNTGDSLLTKSGVKFVGGGDCDAVPAMYPQSVDPSDQITPSRDDQVIALRLYGSSGWDNALCAVSFTILDASANFLRCADVQAIATPADISKTVAVVSGAFAPATDSNGDGFTDGTAECTGTTSSTITIDGTTGFPNGCGSGVIAGLDPSTTYNITVKPISSQWVGGSSLSPCGNGQLTGITEQIIGTVSGCSSGTTGLGTITTTSTGGISGGSGGGTGGSGGTTSSSSSSGCSSLVPDSSPNYNVFFMIFLSIVPLMAWRIRRSH